MKKFLTFFSGVGAIVMTTATVVSCTARPIDSLANHPIKMAHKNVYDITNWGSDVVDANEYKKHFVTGLKQSIAHGKIDSILDLIENDYTRKTLPFIAVLLETFNLSANQKLPPIEDKDKFTAQALAENLGFTIFNLNKTNAPKVTSWNGQNWVREASEQGADLLLYRPETNAFVVNMGIEIKPLNVEQGPFVGAKINVTEENKSDALDAFYSQAIKSNPEYYQQTTTYKIGGDGKLHFTSNVYDYRYKVQFYFQLT
ncbi:hypothetical protein [Williamsoniiplasma lucivorax]|uniref:Lipoprotein n=1 Tax=Williamsoniiplasma lucivorax TaxID=209274 RepID=A0A2S5REM1_9MOLU|nr:hypothetical protein [Williamsoniiplasma lucivorax]PPE05738.1 hypothetical protein ELUCI_v1c00240 [Williamsoniiplasma lucivorax]